jgi:hypothetical protein
MGTPALIHFQDNGKTEAIVYRHWDGDDLEEDLNAFLDEVEKQCADTRFDDPTYLAAKFVVWQAAQYTNDQPLNFLGVGICIDEVFQTEYNWAVSCTTKNRPTIQTL